MDAGSPPSSPTRPRRRSSFFNRRDSLIAEPVKPVEPVETSTTSSNVASYMEKLEAEAAEWKRLYRDKKRELGEKKRMLEQPDLQVQPDDAFLQYLLNEEIKGFLRFGPDTIQLKDDCIQFCKESDIAASIYQEFLERNKRAEDYTETLIQQIKKTILEDSRVD